MSILSCTRCGRSDSTVFHRTVVRVILDGKQVSENEEEVYCEQCAEARIRDREEAFEKERELARSPKNEEAIRGFLREVFVVAYDRRTDPFGGLGPRQFLEVVPDVARALYGPNAKRRLIELGIRSSQSFVLQFALHFQDGMPVDRAQACASHYAGETALDRFLRAD